MWLRTVETKLDRLGVLDVATQHVHCYRRALFGCSGDRHALWSP